jgi:hypothetical protein
MLRRGLGVFLTVVALPLLLANCASEVGSEEVSSAQAAAATEGARSVGENPDVESPARIAAAHAAVEHDFGHATDPSEIAPRAAIPAAYAHLDPDHVIPTNLLETAVTYFDQNKDNFPNKNYITVVDLKARSDTYRFFLVDMQTGSVERYHTTHGRGGDTDDDGYAETFGNVPNSLKSSLGFVRTAEVYSGTYGVSVRLDGLSKTNSNIRDRAVVFHGWEKAYEANVKQGRSAGCITLDYAVKDPVLQKLKEGSFMYVGLGS